MNEFHLFFHRKRYKWPDYPFYCPDIKCEKILIDFTFVKENDINTYNFFKLMTLLKKNMAFYKTRSKSVLGKHIGKYTLYKVSNHELTLTGTEFLHTLWGNVH